MREFRPSPHLTDLASALSMFMELHIARALYSNQPGVPTAVNWGRDLKIPEEWRLPRHASLVASTQEPREKPTYKTAIPWLHIPKHDRNSIEQCRFERPLPIWEEITVHVATEKRYHPTKFAIPPVVSDIGQENTYMY
jgi:hypothetical protein